jgi:hypothetical protein
MGFYFASSLYVFKNLETLILGVDGEVGSDEESIRKDMEDQLLEVKDRLALQEPCQEWKLPAVKVMDAETLESPLWL